MKYYLILMLFFVTNVFAHSPITLKDYSQTIGLGCYGRCGHLDVSLNIDNLAYEKEIVMHYKSVDSDWKSVEMDLRSISNEENEIWGYKNNFLVKDFSIKFYFTYKVNEAVYYLPETSGVYFSN